VVCEGERVLAAYGQFNEGACLFHAQSSVDTPEDTMDYVIYIDSGKPAIRRMAARYSPENLRGTAQERLLHGWSAACEIALSYVLDNTGQDSIDYSTGFLFSDENQAVCMSDSNAHALLLNPIDKRGRMKYKIGASMLPSQLLALALHEAVHSKESYHNEVFAGLLTDITALVKPGDYRQIKRALRKK